MSTIIFTAHPSSSGFTHAIATAYAAGRPADTAEIINLYAPEWRQDFLAYETVENWPADAVREKLQAKIAAASELVFVFPIWWGDAPAILKNFLDCNLTAGFAFRYGADGKPEKLLTGKTARVLATCDAPGWMYRLFPVRLAWLWGLARLGFCGVKMRSFEIFDKKRRRTAAEREAFLQRVRLLAAG